MLYELLKECSVEAEKILEPYKAAWNLFFEALSSRQPSRATSFILDLPPSGLTPQVSDPSVPLSFLS